MATAEKTRGLFETAEEALAYITAGNAKVTLRSKVSGVRFTFKIRKKDDNAGGTITFVSLLNGPDNWTNYAYIGLLTAHKGLRLTAKSNASEDAPSVKGFRYAWNALVNGVIPGTLEIWHEGSCGRCGKTLTVPESIASGIGPECAKKI